jgi:hypothetical protein
MPKDLLTELKSIREQIQDDLTTFLDGLPNNGESKACQLVVDRFKPLIDKLAAQSKEPIQRFTCETKQGNTLQFFYNPDNNLVVVDLIAANEKGGNELVRKTLDEKVLLAHAR